MAYRTLADRLSEGPIPAPEALRYATLIGEELRKIHDSGRGYGAVSAESIILTPERIELVEAPQGTSADTSGDFPAFGSLLCEMLTGRKPATGEDGPVPVSTGIPAADRLIADCLTKWDPAPLRRIQKILLELKLVTVAARRAEAPAPNLGLRAEMRQVESRLVRNIEEHERTVAGWQESAGDALHALHTGLAGMESKLSAAQQGLAVNASRVSELERIVEADLQRNKTLEARIVEEIRRIDNRIDTQVAGIKAIRASVAQADDLVERLVEAIEAIQEPVLSAV